MRVGSKGQSGVSTSSPGLPKVQTASSAWPWVAKVTAIEAKRPMAQANEKRAQATLELNTVQRWTGEATGQWTSGCCIPHARSTPGPGWWLLPQLHSPFPGSVTYQSSAGEVA